MAIKKAIALLKEAENEVMAEVGKNNFDFDDARELIDIVEKINEIEDELDSYDDGNLG